MDLTSPKTIKDLLSKYETRPSKGLGQNFLIDARILEKIIATSDIAQTDTILEVGPGIGTLTQELAQRAKHVIAVEKSETMCKILTNVLSDINVRNVQIVNADILKLNPTPYTLHPYKLVANIPYYLTSPLIRMFLESQTPPTDFVLMLQKEVAQRICSKPPKMSLLAVSVQFYAEAKIISYVSKNCFYPAPKVDSAIIRITPKPYTLNPKTDLFFRIVKAGFSQPRKQLASNLAKMLKLEKSQTEKWLAHNKINPAQRAETLSIDDWKNLTSTLEMVRLR